MWSNYQSSPDEYTEFIPFIKAVGRGEKLKRDLTYEESRAALRLILKGEATLAQVGAFLIAQRVKGEAVDEILGFTDVVREEFISPIPVTLDGLLDLAPPYDGKAKTAQLSPAVALLLAEAGVPVILHGDEGVPTKEGVTPSMVLRALGVQVDLPSTSVGAMIDATGFGYVGAAQYVPAWHQLLPIRREFGLRTLLNTVEKLFNPADAAYQVSGFFHGNYIERIRSTQTGRVKSWMVQGEEGSIEMAAGRKTRIFAADAADDVILSPQEVGLPERERLSMRPDVGEHVALTRNVLAGDEGPAADQVALTAGAILLLLEAVSNLSEGVTVARRLLVDGSVNNRLERIANFVP